jgi:hypothetical protein
MATFSVRSTRPKLLQALPWGREKGRAMPAEPILFTRGIKSGNVQTGGEGRKGDGMWE